MEAELMTRKKIKSSNPLFHARTITLCPSRKIHHECLPKAKPGFTNYPVYQLCLQIRRTLIIVEEKTDLQRLHSYILSPSIENIFICKSSNKMKLLCIISNMLWLDVTPSFCNNHNRKYDPSKQRYPMNIINKREK